MKKRILILGGGGFIGGHLGRHFKKAGCNVTIADLKYHEYFKISEISDDFIITDLRNWLNVSRLFTNKYDEIYQLASDVGGAGYIFSGLNDADIVSNSALININIAKESRKHKIEKLFFSSSSCAYPVPDGNYGHEKLFSEILYSAFRRNYGINIKIGRFQNVFGPYDKIFGKRERFITAICRKIACAKPGDSVEVWGDGTQKRSFIYVEDCIRGIIALMDSNIHEPHNIGTEKSISINDITKLIIDISGKKLNIENIYGHQFFQKYGFECPVGVVAKETAGDAEISIQGLKNTYQWVNDLTHEN